LELDRYKGRPRFAEAAAPYPRGRQHRTAGVTAPATKEGRAMRRKIDPKQAIDIEAQERKRKVALAGWKTRLHREAERRQRDLDEVKAQARRKEALQEQGVVVFDDKRPKR
jgi:hypothetical protein